MFQFFCCWIFHSSLFGYFPQVCPHSWNSSTKIWNERENVASYNLVAVERRHGSGNVCWVPIKNLLREMIKSALKWQRKMAGKTPKSRIFYNFPCFSFLQAQKKSFIWLIINFISLKRQRRKIVIITFF